jgi:hypothetical protein
MRHLMKMVAEIETDDSSAVSESATSSYHPEEFIPCVDNGSNTERTTTNSNESPLPEQRGCSNGGNCEEVCRFLPCHYFDYIGGTSTGGYVQ